VILLGARSLASFSIEYQWWKELGQIDTWLAMLAYGFAPMLAATLIAFGVLWVAHARALKFAGTRTLRASDLRLDLQRGPAVCSDI
jgi:uncharacterized protein